MQKLTNIAAGALFTLCTVSGSAHAATLTNAQISAVVTAEQTAASDLQALYTQANARGLPLKLLPKDAPLVQKWVNDEQNVWNILSVTPGFGAGQSPAYFNQGLIVQEAYGLGESLLNPSVPQPPFFTQMIAAENSHLILGQLITSGAPPLGAALTNILSSKEESIEAMVTNPN